MMVETVKRFSLKMLRCEARAFPVGTATLYMISRPFFTPRKTRMRYESEKAMKRMRAVESDSVKLARKAKDKLHKACERAPETRERTLHRQEQNRMRMASMRESALC